MNSVNEQLLLVASELDKFQRRYDEATYQNGRMPGNELYGPMLMEIVVRARAAISAAEAAQRPCPYCDGTGDVHSRTGEWRGVCSCEAGKVLQGETDGVARAIEAVAAAIYFADSSDYLSTLWDTMRFLSPEIAAIAESDTRAAWERAEQDRAILSSRK